MERLLALPSAVQSVEWAFVRRVSTALAVELPEPLRFEIEELGRGFAESARALCDAARGSRASTEAELMRAASDVDTSAASLRWLRLVTSAYMRAHAQTFEPVCVTGSRSFDDFLAADVESMGVEADEMQVQALTAALEMRVRVEYLDAASTPWSSRSGVHRFLVCGPTSGATTTASAASDAAARGRPPASSEPLRLVACLLYRPGHYDVLIPRDWEAMDRPSEPRAVCVPPLPPDDADVAQPRPTPPEDACPSCGKLLLGCWFCGHWVCPGPLSRCARFGLPPAADPSAQALHHVSGSLARGLKHRLPACFGLPCDQGGVVCPPCLSKCPPADGIDVGGAAFGVDAFALLRCGCGVLDFPATMQEHLHTCAYARRRATPPTDAPDSPPPRAVRPPAAPLQRSRSPPRRSPSPQPPQPRSPSPRSPRSPRSLPSPPTLPSLAERQPPSAAPPREIGREIGREGGARASTPRTVTLVTRAAPEHEPRRPLAPRRPGSPADEFPAAGDGCLLSRGVDRTDGAGERTDGAGESTDADIHRTTADAHLVALVSLGFSYDDAADALRFAGGNVQAAAQTLLEAEEEAGRQRRAAPARPVERTATIEDFVPPATSDGPSGRGVPTPRERARAMSDVDGAGRPHQGPLARASANAPAHAAAARPASSRREGEERGVCARTHPPTAGEPRASEAALGAHDPAMALSEPLPHPLPRGFDVLPRGEPLPRDVATARLVDEPTVSELQRRPDYYTDWLVGTLRCHPDEAARAVHAAIKTGGGAAEAASLVYEPEEVDMILSYSNADIKHSCPHCRRGFRTFAAYQSHSSRRMHSGSCRQPPPQHSRPPVRSPPRPPEPRRPTTSGGGNGGNGGNYHHDAMIRPLYGGATVHSRRPTSAASGIERYYYADGGRPLEADYGPSRPPTASAPRYARHEQHRDQLYNQPYGSASYLEPGRPLWRRELDRPAAVQHHELHYGSPLRSDPGAHRMPSNWRHEPDRALWRGY